MTRDEARRLLGLQTGFTEDDLKKAWKKAAKENHPDLGGDVEKFKKISEANDLLQLSLKRGSASGGPMNWESEVHTGDWNSEGFEGEDLLRRFHAEMAERFRHAQENARFFHNLFFDISIEEAFKGGKHTVMINGPNGVIEKTVDINPGVVENELITTVEEGKFIFQVYVRIKSEYSIDWGNMGNPFDRGNITKLLSVSALKMIMGGWEHVEMIDGGTVKVYIPPGSQTGSTLKVQEKGYWRGQKAENRGHCFLRLVPKIEKLAEIPQAELDAFVTAVEKMKNA